MLLQSGRQGVLCLWAVLVGGLQALVQVLLLVKALLLLQGLQQQQWRLH